MKSYITVTATTIVCLLAEAILAMVLYAALKCATAIDNCALWIGCCILAGCLFISVMLAAVIGIYIDGGKQSHETTTV